MITEDEPPTPCLWAHLGAEIQYRRTAAGLTQGRLAELTLCTQAMISYMESGTRLATEKTAALVDGALGADGAIERLYAVVRVHPHTLCASTFAALESRAASLRSYESELLPALLQTEHYARAAITAARPDRPDRLVALRMGRQKILTRPAPPHAWFVIHERALRRTMGGFEVMEGQLRHLLTCGDNPRTVVQVIPEGAGDQSALGLVPFTVLGFDSGPTAVHVSGPIRGRMSVDEAETGQAERTFDLLRAEAVSPRESADLIRHRLDGVAARAAADRSSP